MQGHIGRFVVNQPMVIGHESAGTVVEVGEGVQHLQACSPCACTTALVQLRLHSSPWRVSREFGAPVSALPTHIHKEH